MSLGKNDQVPPPPGPGEYDIRFSCRAAAVGWKELSQQAATNTRWAWDQMRSNPAPKDPDHRHHRLRGDLADCVHDGMAYPQWQLEVTSGARVWYLFDADRRTCWVKQAGTGHPSQTDK